MAAVSGQAHPADNMPNIPTQLFNQLLQRGIVESPEAPLPWNQPQQAFDMFGSLGGSPEEEAARLSAERNYDYAMADAQRTARMGDPRSDVWGQTLAADTPAGLEQELFTPLRRRWEGQAPAAPTPAPDGFKAMNVGGGSLAMIDPTGNVTFKQAPAGNIPEAQSVQTEVDEYGAETVKRKMTPTQYDEYKRHQTLTSPGVIDKDTQKELDRYAALKEKIDAENLYFGPDKLWSENQRKGLSTLGGDYRKEMKDLGAKLRRKGFNLDAPAAPAAPAAPKANRTIVFDKSGKLSFSP